MPGCVRLCVYTYIEIKSTMCYAEKGITLTHIKKFCDLSVKAVQSELCNLLLCFKARNILSPSAQIEIDQYLIWPVFISRFSCVIGFQFLNIYLNSVTW